MGAGNQPDIADGVMHEPEVALRLAFWLLDRCGGSPHADLSIDGANIKIEARAVFDIQAFLKEHGWLAESLRDGWRGTYRRDNRTLSIKSAPGFDVQVTCDDKRIRAECKGGRLRPKGRSASAILASAIGQAIACADGADSEQLWIAVPDSESFEKACRRIMAGAVFKRTGIQIALVSRTGTRVIR